MAALKNQKHELFAQALAKGKSQTEAYALAGYSPSEQNASRLRRNDKVQDRLKELQSKGAERAAVTIESLIAEAAEIQAAALKEGQHSAAVAALTAKAKLSGLWIERQQSENTNVNYAVSDEPQTEQEWAERHVTSH